MNYDFCDAHFHLTPLFEKMDFPLFPKNFFGCSCSHSKEEFFLQKKLCEKFFSKNSKIKKCKEDEFLQRGDFSKLECENFLLGKSDFFSSENFSNEKNFHREKIFFSFGIHPQNPVLENADFLEELLQEKKIIAVGEAGFDFFTSELKKNFAAQKAAFEAQIELAKKYCVPLVLHGRKSMQKFFEYAPQLKKIPSVIFHSFAGSPNDADFFLKRGVNAFFSFGKPLLKGAKKARECVKTLPLKNILFETDSPFQTQKGERATVPFDIAKVYQCGYELRNLRAWHFGKGCVSFADFCEETKKNFFRAFFSK